MSILRKASKKMVYSHGFRDAYGHVSSLKGEKYHARN